MFDFDSLREIGATVSKNKLRTFLTGTSIAWGIFMLILLLGAGNGLKNGITSNFSSRAQNTVSIGDGYTTIAYKGLPLDRNIKLDEQDFNLISQLPQSQYITGYIYQSGNISYNKEYGSWNMQGVYPDAKQINIIKVDPGKGRFINELDIIHKRKVIVINTEMQEILFKDEEPLGKYIIAQGIAFQVIGIYKDEAGRSNVPAYIPFSTALTLYNRGIKFTRIDFTVLGLTTVEQNEAFTIELRKKLAALHRFDPKDQSAIWINNRAEDVAQAETIFNMITLFIWAIGICSLMAGIVGIGNIMLITVKERTREFGIRKAIGAKPISILKLVLFESILVTSVFGYTGMVAGIAITEIVSKGMETSAPSDDGPTIFKNPTVDLSIALEATAVLIIAGVVAGYIPAKRAVSVSPIEAMRAE